MKFKKMLPMLVTGVLLTLGFAALNLGLKPSISLSKLRIATVDRGVVSRQILCRGRAVPQSELVLTAPYSSMVVSLPLSLGARITRGDQLMVLDHQAMEATILELQDRIDLEKQLEQQTLLQGRANLQRLKMDHEIQSRELELQRIRQEQKERLYQLGSLAEQDLQDTAMELEISELQLTNLTELISLEEAALEAKSLEFSLRRAQQLRTLQRAGEELQDGQMRAPMDGILTWIGPELGQRINAGDPLLRIADLSNFQIEGHCSQENGESLHLGLEVCVSDGERSYRGMIESIDPILQNGMLSFTVGLPGEDNINLRYNQPVEISIALQGGTEELRIPLWEEQGLSPSSNRLYRINGNHAERLDLAVLYSDSHYLAINGDLQEGDQIILNELEGLDSKRILLKE